MSTLICIFLVLFSPFSFAIVRFERIDEIFTSNKTLLVHRAEANGNHLHMSIEVLRPLNYLHLELSLFKEDSLKFRQLFKSPQIEYCKVISKKSRSNPLVRTFVVPALKAVPQFATCPLQGAAAFNVTFDSKMLTMFPNSQYMIKAHAFRADDPEIIRITLIVGLDN